LLAGIIAPPHRDTPESGHKEQNMGPIGLHPNSQLRAGTGAAVFRFFLSRPNIFYSPRDKSDIQKLLAVSASVSCSLLFFYRRRCKGKYKSTRYLFQKNKATPPLLFF